MIFGAILPHTFLFGGVKHYLEVAETIIARGHSFFVFTPDGIPPNWCSFSGEILPLEEINEYSFDILLTSEENFLENLLNANTTYRVFYMINQNKALKTIRKHKEIIFFANSTRSVRWVQKRIKLTPFKAFCGVNINDFYPNPIPRDRNELFTVLTYGRQSMKLKGTHLVKAACENLHAKGYKIKLLLFDTLSTPQIEQDYRNFSASCPWEFIVNHPVPENKQLYWQADCFASGERKGTWANTASEAMACGIPVIASSVGSDDFLIPSVTGLLAKLSVHSIEQNIAKLYNSPELCKSLTDAGSRYVTQYQWQISADQIVSLFERSDCRSVSSLSWPYSVNQIAAAKLSSKEQKNCVQPTLPAGVYIINYHSILDPETASETEKQFATATTSKQNFIDHIDWLRANATAIRLDEVPELLKQGKPTKAYFVLTFDDGFRNNLTVALPELEKRNITAAAFVNSDLCEGGTSLMVKLSYLTHKKGFKSIQKELKTRFAISISKPKRIYEAVKNSDHYTAIEQWVNSEIPEIISEQIHLSWDDIRELQNRGWLIGNHTANHENLAKLSHLEQFSTIEKVIEKFEQQSVPLAPYLAFPYGAPEQVNGSTLTWMMSHPDWFGLFAIGGVNQNLNRTELLRIGIADHTLEQFVYTLHHEAVRSTKISQ